MTPFSYMALLQNLDVPYLPPYVSGGCRQIAYAPVHLYINQNSTRRRSNSLMRDDLQRIAANPERQEGGVRISPDPSAHMLAMRYVYSGVGNVAEIRLYISYALTYGRTNPAGLRSFCESEAKLGVDCAGFASNYLLGVGLIPSFQSPRNFSNLPARSSVGEIRPRDLLLWLPDTEKARRQREEGNTISTHVALVEENLGSGNLHVVESSGTRGMEGLSDNRYQIEPVDRPHPSQGPRFLDSAQHFRVVHGPRRTRAFTVRAFS